MIIVVFPQIYGVHGIARYLQSFLQYAGKDEMLVLTGSSEAFDLKVSANIRIVNLPMPNGRLGLVRWGFAARSYLKKMARTTPISVINLHIPPLLSAMLVPRVAPICVTVHTTYLGMSGGFYLEKHYESQWNILSVEIKRFFERIIFYKASSILALTEQGRSEVLRYGFRKPIFIVPNGVSVDTFTPSTQEKTIDVVFVGRIEKRKGSRPLIDICKRLIAAKPDIQICIVDYGDDFNHLRGQLANYVNNIEITGKRPFDEVLDYYRNSKVYASTSYYEGLPGTCLEAMSVGLPAVVWDYLFYRGLVQDGVNGVVVEPNNLGSFCEAILSILEDDKRRLAMSSSARSQILSGYDWKILGRQISDILSAG